MAIVVTCPGCRKSFSVRDEFGGRTGPCPKCKTMITIPKAGDQVKVHGGEAFGANAGQMVLKPIKRRKETITLKTVWTVGGGVLAALLLTWLVGLICPDSCRWIVALVELVLVAPPVVYGTYYFLRDSESLKDLEGRDLWTRVGFCALGYVLLWVGFGIVSWYMTASFGGELWIWIIAAAPFAVVGALVSSALLEMEFGDGFLHASFFVALTVVMRYLLRYAFEVGEFIDRSGGSIPLDPRA